MNELTSRRGRFIVSRTIVDNHTKDFINMMKHFAPVRAEMLYHIDAIEYIAISPLFDPVDHGEIVPEYDVYVENGKIGVEKKNKDKEVGIPYA